MDTLDHHRLRSLLAAGKEIAGDFTWRGIRLGLAQEYLGYRLGVVGLELGGS